MRVTLGDSGLCCTCVTYFERLLTPLCADSINAGFVVRHVCHPANVAFAALVAAQDGIDPTANRKWAAEQLNYLLGDNPHDGGCFSYEIGYGDKYPLQPHHRAA